MVDDTDKYLLEEQLPVLEQIIRLHYDLQINMEGIDVITHMLAVWKTCNKPYNN
ncbi:MAG: hypothetical protein IPL98_19685 [Saprospiraceae bacterium]|nr:hypothetical protein [Saprospiraceae bacterium]